MTNGDKIRSMSDEELARFLLTDDNIENTVEPTCYEENISITTEKIFDLPYDKQSQNAINMVINWLKKDTK